MLNVKTVPKGRLFDNGSVAELASERDSQISREPNEEGGGILKAKVCRRLTNLVQP